MTKRAILYARISYYDHEGDSLPAQLEMCRDYARQRSYHVVAELSEDDRGASGAEMNLPALNRALELAQAGQADLLITREMDRFTRSLAKQLIVEGEFKTAGAGIEYVLGEYPDTPEGQLNKNVRAVIAEYERLKIAERMERGRRRSVKRGNVMVHHQNVPYGYQVAEADGRRIVIPCEPEAGAVRQIYQWYVYGDGEHAHLGLTRIARKLSDLGIKTSADSGRNPTPKTRGVGVWEPSSVRYILRNPVYRGQWTYTSGGETIAVEVEPLVDEGLWRAAQRQMRENQHFSPRNTKHKYLLRQRIRCGKCGYRMFCATVRRRRKSGPVKYRYYRCQATEPNRVARACDAPFIRVGPLDAAVWEGIGRTFMRPEVLADLLRQHQEEAQDRQSPVQAELERIEHQMDEHKAVLRRLLDLYLDGQFSRDVAQERQVETERRLQALDAERERLLQQAKSTDTETQIQTLQEMAEQIRAAIQAAGKTFERRAQVVDALQIEVVATRDHAEVSACSVPIFVIDSH